MSHHITEGDAIANAMPAAPLACPHCGCTDPLHAVELAKVPAATARTGDGPVPDDTSGKPLRNTQHWPERGFMVCRNCGQSTFVSTSSCRPRCPRRAPKRRERPRERRSRHPRQPTHRRPPRHQAVLEHLAVVREQEDTDFEPSPADTLGTRELPERRPYRS